MNKSDIYVRGWGAVTTLGWSASESAQNLIAGKVPPAKAGSSSHLISREFKAFEVPYAGNPLDKSQAMLDSALTEAICAGGTISLRKLPNPACSWERPAVFLSAMNMNLPKRCAKIRTRNHRRFPAATEAPAR